MPAVAYRWQGERDADVAVLPATFVSSPPCFREAVSRRGARVPDGGNDKSVPKPLVRAFGTLALWTKYQYVVFCGSKFVQPSSQLSAGETAPMKPTLSNQLSLRNESVNAAALSSGLPVAGM